jgi:hypothetical protein
LSGTNGGAATGAGIVDVAVSDAFCAASKPEYGARQAATAKRASEPGSDETVAFAMRSLPPDVMPGAIFRLPASRTEGM